MAEVVRQNHVEIAKDLMHQWEDKPKAIGLVEALIRELDNIETLLFELLDNRGIYTAFGIQLDIIGALFNEDRNGRSDTVYRSAILGRISQQYADGTTEKFLESLRVISGSDNVDFWEHYSGDVHAYMGKGITLTTWSSVLNAAPAGVNVRVIFDNDGDSFVPTELLSQAYDLQTNLLQDIQTNNGEDLQVNIALSAYSERAILAELQDDVVINPMADLAFTDVRGVSGNILVDVNDTLVDYLGDNIVYDSYEFI